MLSRNLGGHGRQHYRHRNHQRCSLPAGHWWWVSLDQSRKESGKAAVTGRTCQPSGLHPAPHDRLTAMAQGFWLYQEHQASCLTFPGREKGRETNCREFGLSLALLLPGGHTTGQKGWVCQELQIIPGSPASSCFQGHC